MAEHQLNAIAARPEYYRPPARPSVPRLIFAAMVAIAIAIVAACFYAAIVYYMPLVYANVVAGALYGALVGWGAVFGSRLARLHHARSTLFIAVIAMVAGFVMSWACWLDIVLSARQGRVSAPVLLTHPRIFAEAIAYVYQTGTWSVGPGALAAVAAAINGPMLALVWFGEAVLLFAFTIIAARLFAITTPLCPRCRVWCSEPKEIHRYSGNVSGLETKSHLEEHDWSWLANLPAASSRQIQILILEHQSCPRCRQTHFLSLRRRTRQERRSRFSQDAIAVMDKLVISDEDLAVIAATPAIDPTGV